MAIALDIPADILESLQKRGIDVSRRALELFAVDEYKSGELSRGEVGRILGLNYYQVEEFLKAEEAYLDYGAAELEQDRAALNRTLSE